MIAMEKTRRRRFTGENRIVVGVGDAACSSDPDAVIVTHALGSCLGIGLYDPLARIAGLFHPMLPAARITPERAKGNPYACVDTGFHRFMTAMTTLGARKERLIVKVAGGGCMYATSDTDFFDIGKRNYLALRSILEACGMSIAGSCVGGTRAQTVFLHVASGRMIVSIDGEDQSL